MDTVIGVLVFVPLFILAGLTLAAAAGFLWAPFAAMITRREAQRHGLTGSRYLVAGALYSLFLLAPWFHLISQMRGDKTEVPIGWTFTLLYTSWMVGPIALLWIAREVDYGPSRDVISVVFWVMLAAWAVSMIPLLASRRPHDAGMSRPPVRTSTRRPHTGQLLPVRYILPFAFTWVSVVVIHLGRA